MSLRNLSIKRRRRKRLLQWHTKADQAATQKSHTKATYPALSETAHG